MERKLFLKHSLVALGLATIAPLMKACAKDDNVTTDTDTDSGSSGNCSVTPTETAGPYPTKNPSSYERSNIVDGQEGVPLTVKITIRNTCNNCSALSGALVDIWHCSALGYYSEYLVNPGGGYSSVDYTGAHLKCSTA